MARPRGGGAWRRGLSHANDPLVVSVTRQHPSRLTVSEPPIYTPPCGSSSQPIAAVQYMSPVCPLPGRMAADRYAPACRQRPGDPPEAKTQVAIQQFYRPRISLAQSFC
jgi:hypothetical protein